MARRGLLLVTCLLLALSVLLSGCGSVQENLDGQIDSGTLDPDYNGITHWELPKDYKLTPQEEQEWKQAIQAINEQSGAGGDDGVRPPI